MVDSTSAIGSSVTAGPDDAVHRSSVGLRAYRDLRRELEQSVLPLATSVDGSRFELQASLHRLSLRAGGYVTLETDGVSRLGQIISLHQAQLAVGDVAGDQGASGQAITGATMVVRAVRGDGVILNGDNRPFHDAVVRSALPGHVDAWLEATRPRRACLHVGQLSLAPGVEAWLDADGFDRHTFLCGQSGSGKTYSLGLMLERILLETSLRVVVLDPNSDYVRLGELRSGVDPDTSERYRNAVAGVSVWRAEDAGGTPIRLRLSDLQPATRAALLQLDPIADREEYAALSRLMGTDQAGQPLVADFAQLVTDEQPGTRALGLRTANLGVPSWQIWERGRGGSIVQAIQRRDFRCMVVDLGSLASRDEQAAVGEAVLAALWARRRDREPVLIVIDEAHNLCPQHPDDPVTAQATDHVVRIAGEGRKYGLYLLVATQRPQKVHENVLSQCDNLVLMRMNSLADLAFVGEAFSFVPAALLSHATEFRLGGR